jgi:hypothetical protein
MANENRESTIMVKGADGQSVAFYNNKIYKQDNVNSGNALQNFDPNADIDFNVPVRIMALTDGTIEVVDLNGQAYQLPVLKGEQPPNLILGFRAANTDSGLKVNIFYNG